MPLVQQRRGSRLLLFRLCGSFPLEKRRGGYPGPGPQMDGRPFRSAQFPLWRRQEGKGQLFPQNLQTGRGLNSLTGPPIKISRHKIVFGRHPCLPIFFRCQSIILTFLFEFIGFIVILLQNSIIILNLVELQCI